MNFRQQTLTQLAALCVPLAFSLACGSTDNLQAVTMSDDAMGTGGAGEGGATTTGIVASQTTSTAAGFGGSFASNSSTGVGQGGGGGAACGEFELGITKTTSRLLVLFDRSCSMNTKLHGASKWDTAVDAFAQLATLRDAAVGPFLFPRGEQVWRAARCALWPGEQQRCGYQPPGRHTAR